jgi:hypothetical protein
MAVGPRRILLRRLNVGDNTARLLSMLRHTRFRGSSQGLALNDFPFYQFRPTRFGRVMCGNERWLICL